MNKTKCSLIFDGTRMNLVHESFPTLKTMRGVLGEEMPTYGLDMDRWMDDNGFVVIENLDLETVQSLKGWCIDYEED